MSKLIGALAFWGALLVWPQSAVACVCGMVNPSDLRAVRADIVETIAKADAAFSGFVYSADNLHVTFRVDNVWKGKFEASVTLPTTLVFNADGTFSYNTCDPEFELHRSYLVVLYRDPAGALLASTCSVWTGAPMNVRLEWLEQRRKQ